MSARGQAPTEGGAPEFTPGMKRAFELAVEEARAFSAENLRLIRNSRWLIRP